MGIKTLVLRAAALSAFLLPVLAQNSFFFNNTDHTLLFPDLSAGCKTALFASIDCDPYLLTVMTTDFFGNVGEKGNNTLHDAFCRSSCSAGLKTYREKVESACKSDPQPVPGRPANYWAASAQSAHTATCLKESSNGKYCVDVLEELFGASETDGNGLETPKTQLCSNCVISLFRHIQSTPYSNYDQNLATVWAGIQKTCGLSYPTEVQKLQTNLTTPGGFAPPGSSFQGICLSDVTYTVVSGDNCQKIAEKFGVSTSALTVINSLYADCHDLWAGATICIPPKCPTYKVANGDTCDSIGQKFGISFVDISVWNPNVDSYCSNLLAGENICVGPPGGAVPLTLIPDMTATETGIYATATVERPSPVASGTTRWCGKYYLVQPGDFCQLVAMNATVDLGLFKAINPSIDSQCTNLLSGFYYCVRPTETWNGTATSTVVPAPTWSPPGTTNDCYEWYVVQSGDWCGKINDLYAITMKQLVFWNPDLKTDCSNLLGGTAYCVNGKGGPGGNAKRSWVYARGTGEIGPIQTAPPLIPEIVDGGVPLHWPELKAPRYRKYKGVAVEPDAKDVREATGP